MADWLDPKRAEQRIVEGVLRSDVTYTDLKTFFAALDLGDFEHEKARVLLSAAQAVFQATGRVSPDTLITALESQSGALTLVGGVDTVRKLAERAGAAGDLMGHLTIVSTAARRRTAAERAGKLSTLLASDLPAAKKLATELSTDISLLGDPVHESANLADLAAFGDKVEIFEQEVPTPYKHLNELISRRRDGGLPYGSLNAIGARTGIGKTTLLLSLLLSWLEQLKLGVALLNFEMTAAQLGRLLFAGLTGRNPWRAGFYPDFDQARTKYKTTVARWQQQGQLWLRNQGSPALDDVVAYLRIAADKGCRLAIIDTVNRVNIPTWKGRSRWEMMTVTLQRLEQFALERDLCLICTCQENRDRERSDRKDQSPRLSDLADSSEIEKVAATVLQLHRPRSTADPRTCAAHSELWVTKARISGQRGRFCRLAYDADHLLYRPAEGPEGLEELPDA